MKWILILFGSLILKSCGNAKPSSLVKKDHLILAELNTTYHIKTLNGKDVSAYKLVITFNNETKQVSGFSGCNRFFGSYTLKNDSLKFNALGLTRMMCHSKVNTIENKFHQAINRVNRITNNQDSIVLLNNSSVLIEATKEVINNTISLEYTTSDRGSYKSIKADSSTIFIKNKRRANPVTKKLKKHNWDKLLKLVKTINLDTLSSLKPPSKDHQFDGAALANFKITKGYKIYDVPPFDHGKPHLIIEPLVKEILSIAKNIE